MTESVPPTPTSPEPLDLRYVPQYGNPIPAATGSYNRLDGHSPAMVEIHPDISVFGPQAASAASARVSNLHNVITPNAVSVTQSVPPTQQYQFSTSSNASYNAESGTCRRQKKFESYSSNSYSANFLPGPVNYMEDIQLDENALVTVSTKELNGRLKMVSKKRRIEIKLKRRTLKNRRYATFSRTRREAEEKRLITEIDNLRKIYDLMPTEEDLENECELLEDEIRDIEINMNVSLSDTSSDVDTEIMGSI